ncbi:MAG: hypothetical protein J0H42_22290 [Rhizobiales bacterium]|nr:hypothetical protein [Hyphomicrobiales bacterium]
MGSYGKGRSFGRLELLLLLWMPAGAMPDRGLPCAPRHLGPTAREALVFLDAALNVVANTLNDRPNRAVWFLRHGFVRLRPSQTAAKDDETQETAHLARPNLWRRAEQI